MTNKLKNKLKMKNIILEIFAEELQILKSLLNKIDSSEVDGIKEKLNNLKNETELEKIVQNLTFILHVLNENKVYDLAIIFQEFVQRYIFFATTLHDFESYTEDMDDLVFQEEVGVIFMVIFAPFFNSQIDFYAQRFLNIVNTSELGKWSLDLNNTLNELLNKIITNEDVVEKITAAETLIAYFENVDNLLIKLDPISGSSDKELFFRQIMEMNIVLKSISIIITKSVAEINRIKGE